MTFSATVAAIEKPSPSSRDGHRIIIGSFWGNLALLRAAHEGEATRGRVQAGQHDFDVLRDPHEDDTNFASVWERARVVACLPALLES
ncbi:MAG TPA: hypothetical protein VED59_01910 [Acidimicrobiales bacterium]|nr:hypothetical protein [Acidimicrobiales bacterium]